MQSVIPHGPRTPLGTDAPANPSASLFRQDSASIARETALRIPCGCPRIRAEITQKQRLSAKRPLIYPAKCHVHAAGSGPSGLTMPVEVQVLSSASSREGPRDTRGPFPFRSSLSVGVGWTGLAPQQDGGCALRRKVSPSTMNGDGAPSRSGRQPAGGSAAPGASATSSASARPMNNPPSASDLEPLIRWAPGPVVVVDPKFRIVALNDACLRATRVVRDDVIGKDVFETFPDGPGAEGRTRLRLDPPGDRDRDTRQDCPSSATTSGRQPKPGGWFRGNRYWNIR